MTDPRYDQRVSDPVTRRPQGAGGTWGWIVGAAVLVLIVIILIAGWNGNSNTASNAPPATTGSATAPIPGAHPGTVPPASTTGSAVHPMTPATPTTPAAPKTGTQ